MTIKPVPGWPGVTASRTGLIFLHGKGVKQHRSGTGYWYVHLRDRKRRRTVAVHILVCKAFHGRRPTCRHIVGHRNGLKHDNRPQNIRWVTRRENELEKAKHGTDIRGERHPCARLIAPVVRWARKSYATKKTTMALLAKSVGVGHSTMRDAIRGKTWGWLK